MASPTRTIPLMLGWFLLVLTGHGSAGTVKNADEIWRSLERLPAKERENRLTAGAKAEGELVWYTNTGLDNAGQYTQAFIRAYPFIKANFWRGKSRDVVEKVVTEARANLFNVDVIKTTTDLLPVLMERNFLGRYESPARASFPSQAKGLLWTNMNYGFRVFGFNRKKVSRAEAPKTWEDLLQQRWKGEILFDESSLEEVLALRSAWGRDKTVTYLTKLAQQQLLIRRGRDNIAQLLVAGEGSLAVTVYAYASEALRAKGAPVDWVAPDLVPVLIYPLTMARYAAHPYSAALFYDFLISDEGQRMLAKEGRIVADPKIEPFYPRMKELPLLLTTGRVHINSVEDAQKHYKESLQILDQIILQRNS